MGWKVGGLPDVYRLYCFAGVKMQQTLSDPRSEAYISAPPSVLDGMISSSYLSYPSETKSSPLYCILEFKPSPRQMFEHR
jgi:hypothetical protein